LRLPRASTFTDWHTFKYSSFKLNSPQFAKKRERLGQKKLENGTTVAMTNNAKAPYDAFLLVSFGGPEGMEDVMPFLENVLRGKNVPRERMLSVAHHYELFNGVSPINELNRKLIDALKPLIQVDGPKLPIYWGNRNWHPMLADTLSKMKDDGIKHALALVTSAYSSYSSCRQYLEDIENARLKVGNDAPCVDKIRPFFNHPGFIDANTENIAAALAQIPESERQLAEIVFTAHSIPISMASNCAYATQLEEVSAVVAKRLGYEGRYKLVYQSRSGPPTQPWLEPDVCDYIKSRHETGLKALVIAPIGFVSDHMEVIYDLDHEASALCHELNLHMARSATAGAHPRFAQMVRELVDERINGNPKLTIEGSQTWPDFCPADCCPLNLSAPQTATRPPHTVSS